MQWFTFTLGMICIVGGILGSIAYYIWNIELDPHPIIFIVAGILFMHIWESKDA